MLTRIRSRLSYANVMATIAVFLALGGGAAYAANTVFSSDIVNGEVKTADVANDNTAGALTGRDVSNANGGSLTGLDIREGTLSGVASGSSDGASSFAPGSPLEVTVPNIGTFRMDCQDGGTADDSDDEVGAFEFLNSPAVIWSFTDVDNFGPITQTRTLAANTGFSIGQSDGPISIDGMATPTSGGRAVTFYAGADELPDSRNCVGAIHAVRSG